MLKNSQFFFQCLSPGADVFRLATGIELNSDWPVLNTWQAVGFSRLFYPTGFYVCSDVFPKVQQIESTNALVVFPSCTRADRAGSFKKKHYEDCCLIIQQRSLGNRKEQTFQNSSSQRQTAALVSFFCDRAKFPLASFLT